MFAVIKTGGKQYKVQKGDVLSIEKLGLEKGQKMTFDKVLLIEDENKTQIGTPFIENAQVKAVVIENFRDKKIIVFKKKKRKQYRKKSGHRQDLTKVKVEEIISSENASQQKKQARTVKESEKKESIKKQKPKPEIKTDSVKAKSPIKGETKKSGKKTATPKSKDKAVKAEKIKPKTPAKEKKASNTNSKTKESTLAKE